MQWLFLVLSTVASVVAVFGAVVAHAEAQRAHSSRVRLEAQRGKIVGLEHGVEALNAWIQRLQGRVNYLSGHPSAVAAPTPTPKPNVAPFDVCENWLTACRDGPTSDAASCQCDYCTDARARRARLRSELLPARGAEAHAEQVREHKARS